MDYSSTAVFTSSKLFSLLLVVDAMEGDWLEVRKKIWINALKQDFHSSLHSFLRPWNGKKVTNEKLL